MPPHHHPHMNVPLPSFAAAIAPQLTASNGPSTYSSPYASKPAPSTAPQESQQAPTEDKQHPLPQPSPAPEAPPQTDTSPRNEPNEQISQPPVPDKHSVEVIESFKAGLRERLENVIGSASKVDAMLTSAANRVLGFSTESATGDAREEQIVEHMKGTLATARQSNIESIQGLSAPMKPDLSAVPDPPQQLANQEGTQSPASQQALKTTGPERPNPLVTRPTFGQGRTNGPSIPRPPMTTPLMKRANSGSPANAQCLPSAPSSASPASVATPNSTNGASTPKVAASETIQNEGMQHTRKRERSQEDDPDDMRDIKRMAASGPPQLKA